MSTIDQTLMRMEDLEKHIVTQLGREQETEVYCWRTPQVSWQSSADDYTCLCSVVVPSTAVDEYMKDCDRSFEADFGRPAFDDECGETGAYQYSRYGDCKGIEPLVIVRREPVRDLMDIQIAEEFRMFHDLFPLEDSQGWYRRSDNGTVETVVTVDGNSRVVINTHRLKQYLAAKRMFLLVQFDFERYFEEAPTGEVSAYNKGPVRDKSIVYDIESLPARGLDDFKWKSFLHGKKLIQGYAREKCGIGPYGAAQSYPEFKTGYTATGEIVVRSCDPALMAGGFIGTPEDPGPYFPVAFERNVLAPYYADHIRYSVEDGILQCNTGWTLPIDNNRRDCVAVMLKDLGIALPATEYGQWLSHNVVRDGGLSPTSKRRWIGGEFCDPTMPDLLFLNRFLSFQANWLEQEHWPLFLDLAPDDKYMLDGLHTPLSEVQEEFEAQIQALAKILPDSINVKELRKRITRAIPDHMTPIAVLAMALKDTQCDACETHVDLLQLVQDLRDGVAHRKSRGDGGTYRKAATVVGLTDNNYVEVFDKIVSRAISLLEYLLRYAARLGG